METGKRRLLAAAFVILVGAVGYALYSFFTFEELSQQEELLATTTIPEDDTRLEAYYVAPGAGDEGQLEIQRLDGTGDRQVLGRAAMQDKPDSLEILAASLQQVVITSYFPHATRTDTITVGASREEE